MSKYRVFEMSEISPSTGNDYMESVNLERVIAYALELSQEDPNVVYAIADHRVDMTIRLVYHGDVWAREEQE